jgi:hypothetical protein
VVIPQVDLVAVEPGLFGVATLNGAYFARNLLAGVEHRIEFRASAGQARARSASTRSCRGAKIDRPRYHRSAVGVRALNTPAAPMPPPMHRDDDLFAPRLPSSTHGR